MVARRADGSTVAEREAVEAWTAAGRARLIEVARSYHATVTYGDFKRDVESATGIESTQLAQSWCDRVLRRIADCKVAGEPELTSLVVRASGGVGDGFANVLDGPVADGGLEDAAAHERLRCYRFFEAPDLPADGGVPAPSPAVARQREAARRRALRDTPRPACPRCGAWKPSASQLCDNCADA